MILLIDACVAIKWYVDEPDTPQAMRILDGPDTLIAPDFILTELANVGAKKVTLGEMSNEQFNAAMDDVVLTLSHLLPTTEYLKSAIKIAIELKHPVYDCIYVAIAKAFGVKLVTADQKLIKKLKGGAYSNIAIALSDYAAETNLDNPDDLIWLSDERFSDLQRLVIRVNNIGCGLPEFLQGGKVRNVFVADEFVWISPAGIALRHLVDELDSSSRVTLIAAALIPIVENFGVAVEQARTIVSDPEIDLPRMLVQYLPFLSKGLEYLKSRREAERGKD